MQFCVPIKDTRKHFSHSSSVDSSRACADPRKAGCCKERDRPCSGSGLVYRFLNFTQGSYVAMDKSSARHFRGDQYPAASSMSSSVTAAPARSNIKAIALPMPCEAPVTMAVLFSSVIMWFVNLPADFPRCRSGARDRRAAQVTDIQIVFVKRDVRRPAQQYRPTIPRESLDSTRGIDPVNVVACVATRI